MREEKRVLDNFKEVQELWTSEVIIARGNWGEGREFEDGVGVVDDHVDKRVIIGALDDLHSLGTILLHHAL